MTLKTEDHDTYREIAVRIKGARLKKKFTIREVADGVGLSEIQYSRVESGKTTPTGVMMFKIARTLDIPVEILFPETVWRKF